MKRAALFLFLAALLFADGGTVLFRKQAGPFLITAFAEPTPVRAGAADLSAMVQRVADQQTILDASVSVHLRQSANGKIVEVIAPATHANATNKLLYAAHVRIPSPGAWTVSVDVKAKQGAGMAAGTMDVLPQQAAGAAYWPYFLFIPLAIAIFVLNRWLRNKWRVRNPPVRP